MNKKNFLLTFFIALFLGSLVGSALSFYGFTHWGSLFDSLTNKKEFASLHAVTKTNTIVKEESSIIDVVKKASPAVVSIIVTKDLPTIERRLYSPFGDYFPWYQVPVYKQRGYEKKTIGGGTGFIVTKDGYVVTNRHVVSDPQAEYTVLMNDKQKFPAKVLVRYELNDVAILKITGNDFPTIELGNSDALQVGQTVVAIGNALGEYQNTVSQGVISGLSRSIAATGQDPYAQYLFDLIQTDAAINLGNSGGPLISLGGQVIGINTAIAYGSQNIGFAIPINSVKNIIDSVYKHGKVIQTFLGVRYVMLTEEIVKQLGIKTTQGALVVGGRYPTQGAVVAGSPAEKIGIKENDIITKVNDQDVNNNSPLFYLLNKYKPGDTVIFTVTRDNKEIQLSCTLEAMK
ncbi:MAG: protease Do [uncultured bacterium]|nr:MAG: protease Do [uncultured bacterium]